VILAVRIASLCTDQSAETGHCSPTKLGSFCNFAVEDYSVAAPSLLRLTLFLGPFSKTHSGTPAVFLNEFDSGGFQGVL
jgi:hypothetical protein